MTLALNNSVSRVYLEVSGAVVEAEGVVHLDEAALALTVKDKSKE